VIDMRAWVAAVSIGISLIAGLCASLAGSATGTPPGTEPGWSFRLRMPDLSAGVLDVELTLPSAKPDREALSVCVFMDSAGVFVRDLRLVDPPSGAKVVAQPDDRDCWDVQPSPQGVWPRRLAYRVDLKAMAARYGEPDYAEHIAGTYIWNEQAVLMHPSPLPEQASIQIELSLPPDTPLAVPWVERPPLPGSQSRLFVSDARQHDLGSYVIFGSRLRSLGSLGLPSGGSAVPGSGASARLNLIDLPHRASDAALRGWMQAALGAVSSFYGDLMPKEIVVTLLPMGNSRDPGIYGSVLRPLRPSALIYFGGDCETPNLHDDWLATHELFHIGNPFIKGRLPWLVEGFTTYYQEVLRARAGAVRSDEVWSDLVRVLGRYCQPQDGRSLAEDSRTMRQTHRYQRVYWGGACLALGLDLAIRQRAGRGVGLMQARPLAAQASVARSLDDVFRKLRRDSLQKPLTEDEILAALDAAAGDHLASRLLRETRQIPVEDWLQKLGVRRRQVGSGQAGSDAVTFDERAPLAAIRRALF
jgi:hypothetical protein